MQGTKRYDGALQMFCEPVHEVDLAKLRFLRWLIEQGKLEHPVAGAPAGVLAGFPPETDEEVDHAADASPEAEAIYPRYPDER